MEENVKLFEEFLKELERCSAAIRQADNWYDGTRRSLLHEQESRRLQNQTTYQQQDASYQAMRDKAARERDVRQSGIRSRIMQKKELLGKTVEQNCRMRDMILNMQNEILRPEFFEFAYRYHEYGDFYPEVTKLEDYRSVDLRGMVDNINADRTGLLTGKVRALLKSEDMMLEYAAAANLIGKARYLCEVENDALRDKVQEELRDLEDELDQAEDQYREEMAKVAHRRKQIDARNRELGKMFDSACEAEEARLEEEYKKRKQQVYDDMTSAMDGQWPAARLEQVYQAFDEAEQNGSGYICGDGVPLHAKLGKLWYQGTEVLGDPYILQAVKQRYPFMLKDDKLTIPGIA